MDTLLTPLLARLTSATGFTFTTNTAGDIVVAADDAFKLAAFVELGAVGFAVEANQHLEDKALISGHDRKPLVLTSVGVQPDFTGRAALDMEVHKLAEAGRKSWVTRRANAAKKGGRK